MKRWLRSILVLVVVLSQMVLSLYQPASTGWAAGTLPPDRAREDAFVQAVQQALQARQDENLALMLLDWRIDATEFSRDGRWAVAWLGLYHPETGELLASEPGLVLGQWEQSAWQVAQPHQTDWVEWLAQAPDDLLTAGQKQFWLDVMQRYEQEAQILEPLSGYYLPWPAGETQMLTGSVIHDSYIPSGTAHYAFDFYVGGQPGGQMWNIYASKSGTVFMWRDTVPNGNDSDIGNYLVLKDDTNGTYQLYLHLAQYSVPSDLKVVGAPVTRGQFLGVADDTGSSTAHHLHFQVHQNANYWGQSLDILYNDVDIYGGRPRLPTEEDEEICGGLCTEGERYYTSGNVLSGDVTPPYGDFSGVTTGDVITSTTLTLGGWGLDADSDLSHGWLMANYAGAWHPIGAEFTSTFTTTWDLCDPAQTIPDGAVSVALKLEDEYANIDAVVGIRHFIKDAACPVPPPACTPGASQAALFAGANYTGACALYEIGDHATLSPLADDDVESILVGQDVVATLYSEAAYTGHSQAFLWADGYLVGDLIGANTAASLRVALRTDLPLPPQPLTLQAGEFGEGDLVPLAWSNGGGAMDYQVQVSSTVTDTIVTAWLSATFTTIGNLPQGEYTWQVRGRGPAGEGPWSSALTFTVGMGQAWGPPVGVPFTDDMESSENDWAATGQWTLKDSSSLAHGGEHAWWYAEYSNYDNGLPNVGTLTSPPISVTGAGYYLRFWYRYQTESHERMWDQRWLQIAVDGGPFENYYQFADDPYNTWLESPAFHLAAYNGHTIRLRFAFLTMDGSLNEFSGWGIDDLSITSTAPPSCSDTRLDDTPAQAFPLTYSTDFAAAMEICPGGDYDYYQFTGSAGDRVVIDIRARVDGSAMDAYAALLDSDGVSILAENDDEFVGDVGGVSTRLHDSLIAYTLPYNGVYYIQVRDWKHPDAGGNTYDYRLRVYTDADEPQVIFDLPPNNAFVPDRPIEVTVQASDLPDDALTVEFYWHGAAWQTAAWTLAALDQDGSDGWSYDYSIAAQPDGWGSAVAVRVIDQAGRAVTGAAWNLGIDHAAPTSAMEPLTITQSSPAIFLAWEGADNLSGIDYYNLQHTTDGGLNWSTPPEVYDGGEAQTWWMGAPGETYGFRMQAVDYSLNTEDYPALAEAVTSIPAADVLCAAPDIYDATGGDNAPDLATPVLLEDVAEVHNFCSPITTTFENDEDWITFTVQAGTIYRVQAEPLHPASAPSLQLFAYEGITLTLISESVSPGFGQTNALIWVADRDGVMYLRVAHLDGRVIGSEVAYSLLVFEPYTTFAPLMNRLKSSLAP